MWILPSLGRPNKISELIEDANLPKKITLILQKTDPRLPDYLDLDYPPLWKLHAAPVRNLVEALNWAWENYPEEKQYSFLGDDVKIEGDVNLLESAAASNFITYPTDSIHGHRLCPHFSIGGDLVRAVGYLAYPKLHHNFIDNVWWEIGRELGLLKHLPEVTFHHQHHLTGHTTLDSTYVKGQSTANLDAKTFKAWLYGGKKRQTIQNIQESGCLKT